LLNSEASAVTTNASRIRVNESPVLISVTSTDRAVVDEWDVVLVQGVQDQLHPDEPVRSGSRRAAPWLDAAGRRLSKK
jgi:hypothetical protein